MAVRKFQVVMTVHVDDEALNTARRQTPLDLAVRRCLRLAHESQSDFHTLSFELPSLKEVLED